MKQRRAGGITIWLVAGLVIAAGIVLFLTHDIIITHVLAYRICHSDPQPKTFIKKTVDFPESIYWEDNIYPGFDEKDRLLMIRNYLDGIHLKVMALNGPDGAFYRYEATPDDWRRSREIKDGKRPGKYFEMLGEESRAIAARGKRISREELGQFNYSVVFNPVPLSDFARRYLWSDEVVIRDNNVGEVIGYNRRLMHRWYILNPDVAMGNRYYYPHAMCGWGDWLYGFPNKLFATIRPKNGNFHGMDINFFLYNKLIKKRRM